MSVSGRPRDRREVVDERGAEAAARMRRRDADLLDVRAAVDDVADQVRDRAVVLVDRHPGAGHVLDRPGVVGGDLRHPDVGERPARLALDLQQELELVVAGRADPRHARAARRWRATTAAIVSGMIATITHWAIGPTTPPTSSQRLPSCWPATISAVFHTSEPVSVSAR